MMARSRETDRRFYGVVEALVVENEDPDGEGRIRVSFPWFSDTEISDWCRVAQLYAGGDFGAVFVPEVDTEVLVVFVHGDMRMPVVIGGVYNGVDKPPTSRSSSTDQKVIRTRAGHQLTFDDRSGSEQVTIETAGGHHLTLSDADSRITLATAGGNTIELDDTAGSISISATAKLTLAAPEVEINGDASVAISGGQVRLN